jgi:hypothetical protein
MFRGFCHSLQTTAIRVFNEGGNVHVHIPLERVFVPLLQMSITNSVCMSVALFNQEAMRMRRTVFLSVACLALQYFFQIIS